MDKKAEGLRIRFADGGDGVRGRTKEQEFFEFARGPEFQKLMEFLGAFLKYHQSKKPALQRELCLDRIKNGSDYNERIAAFMLLVYYAFPRGDTNEMITSKRKTTGMRTDKRETTWKRAKLFKKGLSSLGRELAISLSLEALKEKNIGSNIYYGSNDKILSAVIGYHLRFFVNSIPSIAPLRIFNNLVNVDKKAACSAFGNQKVPLEWKRPFFEAVKESIGKNEKEKLVGGIVPLAKARLEKSINSKQGFSSRQRLSSLVDTTYFFIAGAGERIADPELTDLIGRAMLKLDVSSVSPCLDYFENACNPAALTPATITILYHLNKFSEKCKKLPDKKRPHAYHRCLSLRDKIYTALDRRDVNRDARMLGRGQGRSSQKLVFDSKAKKGKRFGFA